MYYVYLNIKVANYIPVLGKQTERATRTNIKFNNSLLIGQKPNHKLLLNLNAPPLITRTNDLQAVFTDEQCVLCFNCMERALKANKFSKYRPDSEELHSDLLTNTITIHRNKRYVTSTPSTDGKKEKKGKKKSKAHKTIIVTQYNVDGEVYALKVKESSPGSDRTEDGSGSCHVYSVNKVMACNTPEGDALIANVKKNANKKDRRHKDKMDNEEDITPRNIITTRAPVKSVFRKRQTDDIRSQMPENVMSSVEEFY